MKRNWRYVLPPMHILLMCCAIYLLTYLVDLFFLIYFGLPEIKEIGSIRMPVLVIFSAWYGYYRVRSFHPFYSRKYREWLCLTPWSIEKPLPRGPIHLIWADLITLVPLTILAYSNFSIAALVPLILFLSVYLVMICITFVPCRASVVVLCLFLAPFTFYPFSNRYFAILVLILLYIICRVGLHQFLKGFPWNTRYWKADPVKELREQALKQNVIGWPFRYLNIYEVSGISVFGALLWSLLLTWWLHVIQWVNAESFSLFWVRIIALLVALIRICVYAVEYRPPISLLGRIFTGRLIIPRYDKIYIAPICILLAGVVLPLGLLKMGYRGGWIFELSFFLIFFSAFSLPPNLREWRFTGAYRVGRLAQSLKPRPPSPQDQAIYAFLCKKFESLK